MTNTILKKYNGASYDNAYPVTKAKDVRCIHPDTRLSSNLQQVIDYLAQKKAERNN